MPNMKVVNMQGKEVGTVELNDAVYAAEISAPAIHSAVVAYLANQRHGTQSTLTRSEVSGGGAKPYRQKGTGRARQGSTRAPQFTHGGIAFGPKLRSFNQTLNKKTRRLAIRSALSDKVAGENMIVVDEIKSEGFKTKVMAEMLKALGAGKKAIVVLDLSEKNFETTKSFANIAGVKTAYTNTINTYDLVNADTLIATKKAAETIGEVYA